MRQFLNTIFALTLLAATGILAADILFQIETPLGRPSLIVTTVALAAMTWRSRQHREQKFRRAIDSYVQTEEMREMEYELQSALEKQRRREGADSSASQIVVP